MYSGGPGFGSVTPLCISSGHAAEAGNRDRRGGHEAARRRRRRGSRGAPPGAPDVARRRPRGDARHLRRGGRGGARGGPGRGGRRLRDPGAGGLGDGRVALVDAPAARRRALPRPDERAARAAGGGGQRRQRRAAGRGAPRGGARRVARGAGGARDRHRQRAAAGRADLPRRARAGGRARAHGGRPARAGLPGRLPGPRLPRGDGVGSTIGREGLAAAARSPESALGRRLAAGQEITGGLVTELAHDGDEAARLGAGRDRAAARRRAGRRGERVQPGGDRDRRRRDRGRRAAARARARGGGGARAAAGARDGRGSCRPTSATSPGCSARRCWPSTRWRHAA